MMDFLNRFTMGGSATHEKNTYVSPHVHTHPSSHSSSNSYLVFKTSGSMERHELDSLRTSIYKFEKNIDLNEFNKIIMDATAEICKTYELTDIVNMEKLALSAYENYLIRLHQITMYVHKNQHFSQLQVSNILKFNSTHIICFYPTLEKFYGTVESVTYLKRSVHLTYNIPLNNDINNILYKFAVETRNKIISNKKVKIEVDTNASKSDTEKLDTPKLSIPTEDTSGDEAYARKIQAEQNDFSYDC
jgi:hypothetical protein